MKTEVHFFAGMATTLYLFASSNVCLARSARPSEIVRRLQLANVARIEFSPAPNAPYFLAVFVPEHKSESGSVRIYSIPPSQGPESIRATASKSFFRVCFLCLVFTIVHPIIGHICKTDVEQHWNCVVSKFVY